jgi:hypothetical protein
LGLFCPSLLRAATPAITSITHNYGAPGAVNTITGTNFGSTQGSSTLTVNGAKASPSSWSNTSITFAVPSAAALGTGDIVVTVGGQASNGEAFTVVPVPAITSIAPTSGDVGTLVTVTGTNLKDLENMGAVVVDGKYVTETSQSATQVQFKVPSGATSGNIEVNSGGVNSNGVAFTVVPGPAITSITHNYGAPGAVNTITGTNFGASQNGSTVSFNGTKAPVLQWSNTSIVVPVPSGATTGNVTVTVGDETSNGTAFAIYPDATITGISPTSGDVGTLVTITGTNLKDPENLGAVDFNGTYVSPVSVTPTQIQVKVPSGATTGTIGVWSSGFQVHSAVFTVLSAPQITSITHNYGAPGAVNTITGTNFGASQGSSTVTFNGTVATPSSWSNTSIVVAVPQGATTGNITIKVGSQTSNGTPFTVIPAATITSISPTSGTVGTVVTITGTNLKDPENLGAIEFNGTGAPAITESATQIETKVPSGATTGDILVYSGGVPARSQTFTVIPGPQLSSISHNYGAPGAVGTITGTNFGATQGSSRLVVNGAAASPSSWSNTSLTFAVPSGAAVGAGNIILTVEGTASNSLAFTVVPVPAITSIAPTSGDVGTLVTVTGTNLKDLENMGAVVVDGKYVTETSQSATQVQFKVPSGATSGNIEVNSGGVNSNGVAFTVVPGPAITSITHNYGAPGAVNTITGTNFGASQGSSTIAFNGTQAAPSSWSNTSIVVPVPSGATTGNITVTVGALTSNGIAFSIYGDPSISTITPASGAVGALVTIAGNNLQDPEGLGSISFNGTAATPVSESATQIQVRVPSGAIMVAMTIAKAQAALPGTFTIHLAGPEKTPALGETIWVVATVTNVTDHEICISTAALYHVHVEKIGEGEARPTEFHRHLRGEFLPGDSPDASGGSSICPPIAADSSITDRYDLRKYYDLSKPGKYAVYVEMEDRRPSSTSPGIWVRSNTVQFEISDAKN